MAWTYRLSDTALKTLQKLDPPQQRRIIQFLDDRIQGSNDPRQFGKALKGDHKGLWRFRQGDYRIVADLQDEVAVVLVLKVAHRREAYDR